MTTTTQTCANIPRIDPSQVRMLWFCDFWDRPINGLCLYRERKYWFERAPEEEDSGEGIYVILELSADQLAEEERWHELFREKVGTHCDFAELHPEVRPNEAHQEFYEQYAKHGKRDYSKNPAIGWSELNCTRG